MDSGRNAVIGCKNGHIFRAYYFFFFLLRGPEVPVSSITYISLWYLGTQLGPAAFINMKSPVFCDAPFIA